MCSGHCDSHLQLRSPKSPDRSGGVRCSLLINEHDPHFFVATSPHHRLRISCEVPASGPYVAIRDSNASAIELSTPAFGMILARQREREVGNPGWGVLTELCRRDSCSLRRTASHRLPPIANPINRAESPLLTGTVRSSCVGQRRSNLPPRCAARCREFLVRPLTHIQGGREIAQSMTYMRVEGIT
jgi:hypothetical protein